MQYAQSDCIQIYVLILWLDKAPAPQLQVLTSRIDEEQAPAPGFSVTRLARMGSLNIDFCSLKPRRIVRLSTLHVAAIDLAPGDAASEGAKNGSKRFRSARCDHIAEDAAGDCAYYQPCRTV